MSKELNELSIAVNALWSDVVKVFEPLLCKIISGLDKFLRGMHE